MGPEVGQHEIPDSRNMPTSKLECKTKMIFLKRQEMSPCYWGLGIESATSNS
jgi:hypothetical protein